MELKQLAHFVQVAECGSITAAAERLHISQPPLSAQMKALEEECGCRLFERGPRRIRLTEAGKLLYERAQAMLDMAGATASMLEDLKSGAHGTLRLGVVSSVGSTVLLPWLKEFCKRYPGLRFEMTEANTYQLLDRLRARQIELAVVRTPFADGGLECLKMQPEPMMAVGAARFFDGATGEMSVAALAGRPLIVYRRWAGILGEVFREAGVEMEVFCTNDDARTTAHMAGAGLGVGLIPASAASLARGEGVEAHVICDARLESGVAVVRDSGAYMPSAARLFWGFIEG